MEGRACKKQSVTCFAINCLGIDKQPVHPSLFTHAHSPNTHTHTHLLQPRWLSRCSCYSGWASRWRHLRRWKAAQVGPLSKHTVHQTPKQKLSSQSHAHTIATSQVISRIKWLMKTHHSIEEYYFTCHSLHKPVYVRMTVFHLFNTAKSLDQSYQFA